LSERRYQAAPKITTTRGTVSFATPGGLASLPLPPESALITEGNNMSKFTDTLVAATRLPVMDKIKSGLDEESFNDFEVALANQAISCAAINRALKNLGVEVSVNSLQRLRNQ
jgi:hypothetical protein